MRLVRYADDFVVLVRGSRSDAEALFSDITEVLQPIGLALSLEKTKVVSIDEGFDFLGWHIQRHHQRGTARQYVYTYPSKKSLASITEKIRLLTQPNCHDTLTDLIASINRVVPGWCAYFRNGASSSTLQYVGNFLFWRVFRWLLKRHPKTSKRTIVRRYMPGWIIQSEGIPLFQPGKVHVIRYRYRGSAIPNPWTVKPVV